MVGPNTAGAVVPLIILSAEQNAGNRRDGRAKPDRHYLAVTLSTS